MTQTAGLVGAALAGLAYLPQITHLIKERCTAGISRPAYFLWLAAAALLLYHAMALGDQVFMLLSVIQLVSTSIVCLYLLRYNEAYCPYHAPRKKR